MGWQSNERLTKSVNKHITWLLMLNKALCVIAISLFSNLAFTQTKAIGITPLFSDFADPSRQIESRMTADTKIVFVGESHTHKNGRKYFNKLLQEVVGHDPQFNCLFLELPQESQAQLDESVKAKNLAPYIKYFTDQMSALPFFKKKKLDPSSRIADVADALPLSSELLAMASQLSLKIIAFDADFAPGQDKFLENAADFLANPFDPTLQANVLNAMYLDRNIQMARNIRSTFDSGVCAKGIVLGGMGHLREWSDSKLGGNSIFGPIPFISVALKPIQEQLSAVNIKGPAYIIDRPSCSELYKAKLQDASDPMAGQYDPVRQGQLCKDSFGEGICDDSGLSSPLRCSAISGIGSKVQFSPTHGFLSSAIAGVYWVP